MGFFHTTGSGSTLIAAERTGRHACSMELDAQYRDVIVGEKFTGRKAERIPQYAALQESPQ